MSEEIREEVMRILEGRKKAKEKDGTRYVYEISKRMEWPSSKVVFDYAQELGFPSIKLAQGETVMDGEANWKVFSAWPNAHRHPEALRALMAIDDPESLKAILDMEEGISG